MVLSVDTSASPFREGCVGRDAAIIGCTVSALAARPVRLPRLLLWLFGGEVALVPALLKFRGAAVNPNLSLGNQPIVPAGQDAGHGLDSCQSPHLARRDR